MILPSQRELGWLVLALGARLLLLDCVVGPDVMSKKREGDRLMEEIKKKVMVQNFFSLRISNLLLVLCPLGDNTRLRVARTVLYHTPLRKLQLKSFAS